MVEPMVKQSMSCACLAHTVQTTDILLTIFCLFAGRLQKKTTAAFERRDGHTTKPGDAVEAFVDVWKLLTW